MPHFSREKPAASDKPHSFLCGSKQPSVLQTGDEWRSMRINERKKANESSHEGGEDEFRFCLLIESIIQAEDAGSKQVAPPFLHYTGKST
ncbi:hypothetical protein RRG08_046320 [Elysia crispata]|uniref:Uncharacterized protein n=1 Tax=Elysia crispata TaxID=231223 RepID=A0AAE1A5V7_9GAST|nr:hypothetical protein RRG08_046320 [Elysia crispata]